MSSNTPSGNPADDDKAIVDSMEFHLANPCSTPQGQNIRPFYIREAQRLLDTNSVRDPIQRERLSSAIRIAKILEGMPV